MWLISWRDLEFRLRRFVIALSVTAVVFGIALVFDGVKREMQHEVPRIVEGFDADSWAVAPGASGPFTTTKVMSASVARTLRAAPGVRRADPVVLSRTVVDVDPPKDANLIGYRLGGLGAPAINEGRAVRGRGEVVVGAGLKVELGDTIDVGGARLKVVGKTEASRYYFGNPTVFISLAEAQDLVFSGQRLAMAIAVSGEPEADAADVEILTNDEVAADLDRPLKSGVQTIDIVSVLLWLIAAGIIGLIVYLSALERLSDFAVFKATGAPTRIVVGGLVIQAVLVSFVSAVIAIGVARLVSLTLPFPAEFTVTGIVQLMVVAVVVGVLASIAGLRRALRTDPALAFGGA
jgi:putative ABC transport system permease protein